MKNRALLLCLKNDIMTVEDYARTLGVSVSRADLILKEKAILTTDEIKENCKLFNVSADYFLCLVE